jgi:hypothetical protein
VAALAAAVAMLTPAAPAGTQPSACSTASPGYSKLLLADPGLRAYWRLSETTSGVACDLRGVSDGTYRGQYAQGVPGALARDPDEAMSLSGAGWIYVSSSDAPNPTGAVTLEAWVKPSSLLGGRTIIRKDGQYKLRLDDRSIEFRVWTSAGTFTLMSAPVMTTSSYQHVVAVFNGNLMRLYRNASQVATRSAGGSLDDTTGAGLYIGASFGVYDFYAGSVDEVAVYDTALPSAAVKDHFVAGRPSAGSAYLGCGFGAFGAGRWPGGCWRPYSSGSPFNRAVGSVPRLADDSAAVVGRVLGFGRARDLVAGQADTADDYERPVYWSGPGDPLFRLHCYETGWGVCPIEGDLVRVPDAARPAGGADAHLSVVDQDSGWEYDLYKVRSKPAGGGRLVFRWGGRTRIDGNGLGSAATAAKFGGLAGIVRAAELSASHIDHALFMTALCDSGRYVYPARGVGTSCRSLGLSGEGAPPMGARLQLAMSSAEIDALPVAAWKKTILHAIASYGMFIGDTGGGSWGIRIESGTSFTSFGYPDPMVGFAQANAWIPYQDVWIGHLHDGIDWSKRLRVIHPCVTRRTC